MTGIVKKPPTVKSGNAPVPAFYASKDGKLRSPPLLRTV
jgi:hypothetical protein